MAREEQQPDRVGLQRVHVDIAFRKFHFLEKDK